MLSPLDSRHWSQRWMRCAQTGADAVVLYDLYKPLSIAGCGRGRCTDLKGDAATNGPRFRVTRFWGMDTCPHCGRAYGYAHADETLYLGNSESEALQAYYAAEVSFFGYSESA